MKITKQCQTCGNDFLFRNCPSDRTKDGGKYCNKDCRNRNVSKTLKERGIKPTVHFVAYGINHKDWKGDKVSYSGLHKWLSLRLGTPSECEHCGTTEAKKYEWANKDGLYQRNLTSWVRLCTKCHHAYDKIHEKTWSSRRANV